MLYTQLKKSLSEAYSDVWHQLETIHQRQKEGYDKKIHGKSYKEGDFVWLYNQAVPQAQARKPQNKLGDSLRMNSGRIPMGGDVVNLLVVQSMNS